jgi:hypothetical protein
MLLRHVNSDMCGWDRVTKKTPEHWCSVPELSHLEPSERRNLSIPQETRDGELVYSRCRMFDVNYTQVGHNQIYIITLNKHCTITPSNMYVVIVICVALSSKLLHQLMSTFLLGAAGSYFYFCVSLYTGGTANGLEGRTQFILAYQTVFDCRRMGIRLKWRNVSHHRLRGK